MNQETKLVMKIFKLTCNLVFLSCLCVFVPTSAWANGGKDPNNYQATRIEARPSIDGVLDEEIWENCDYSYRDRFTQTSPNNGELSDQETEVSIVYNNQSIFIGATLYDSQPDSIARQFGERDTRGRNADMFAVAFDTYNNKQNAFVFMVSAAGVQADYFISPEGEDRNWNAVWQSAVRITDKGWVVEFEIPYSALRFPKQDHQVWGANFLRVIRRKQERSYWNHVDAAINGEVNQYGTISGLDNISPPVRLSFSPYASLYYLSDGVNKESGLSFNGGMDIKYGINESFTLDMSLIPDFGQVRSDNLVLNLSPFEVRFSENRPFFTEGTELFNKRNLFYSRRVGSTFGSADLEENEEVIESVSEAPLINAVKMSGRTKKGLGIGIFNAVTNQTFALVENTETRERREARVDPLTNFNVFVIDKNLKNNSNFSFINTNVTRFGGDDANVSGTDFKLNDKTNTYQVSGFAALSQKFQANEEDGVDLGYSYNLRLAKVSGPWQYSFSRLVESDTYDINDLGFIRGANEVSHGGRLSYNMFEPKGKLLRLSTWLDARYEQLHTPRTFTDFRVSLSTWMRFKNFWSVYASSSLRPVNSYDYFEPRVTGRYFRRLPSHNVQFEVNTDRRKRLSAVAWMGVWERPVWAQVDNWFGIGPTFRVNDKFSLSHQINYMKRRREPGYVSKEYNNQDELEDIIFGQRTVRNITNTFSSSYAFSARMNVSLRVRHYWSEVIYRQNFFDLTEEGNLVDNGYSGLNEEGQTMHDRNFNAFNVDLVYFWQFAPGSELNIVWKDAIVTNDQITQLSFGENFRNVLNAPQVNSVSIRVLYFLDYLYLKKKS